MSPRLLPLLLACHLFCAMAASAIEPLLVSDFNGELPVTKQDGEIIARQRVPSAVKFRLDDETFHGESGKSLRVEFIRLRGGEECLLLLRIPGVDLTGYNALSFWVKGTEGGEIFDVGIRDAEMDRQEKLPANLEPIEKSLPGGITTEWQKAVIPLSKILGESSRQSGSILIVFNRITKYSVIQIDDMVFESVEEKAK